MIWEPAVWTALAMAFFGLLSLITAGHAYRNGFRDGALWMDRGNTYPSKPHPEWWWWKTAEKEGLDPGMGLRERLKKHKIPKSCPDCGGPLAYFPDRGYVEGAHYSCDCGYLIQEEHLGQDGTQEDKEAEAGGH
jgi:predicted RNA-binding Zn-ribbon protein involved in translation (DUF1610 family)